MSLIILPQYIIDKILLYNIHPVAELIKEKMKKDFDFPHILEMINAFGVYHFLTLNEMQKNTLRTFLDSTKYINRWEFCCERGIECIRDSEYESMYDHIDNF